MSLLIHRLVLLCVAANCFVFWDLPGDVLAAPESVLCGWMGVILLSLLEGHELECHPSDKRVTRAMPVCTLEIGIQGLWDAPGTDQL